MPIIPVLRKLRQEDHHFQAILDYEAISKKRKVNLIENARRPQGRWVMLIVPSGYICQFPGTG